MARSTPKAIIDAEIEAAWRAGILYCLVVHCRIDSAKAVKMVDEIASRSNTLADRQRSARENIAGAVLRAVVDMTTVQTQGRLL